MIQQLISMSEVPTASMILMEGLGYNFDSVLRIAC